jgi:hypothetical protein
MRWALTMKHGRWPEMRTYHPEDPFALWRELDAQHYQLDRFFTKLLKLQEAMMTTTGRAMAGRRIAFLHRYLQELQHELTIGGSGYDMSEEVTSGLLLRKLKGEEPEKEEPGEDLQHERVVDMPYLSPGATFGMIGRTLRWSRSITPIIVRLIEPHCSHLDRRRYGA